ncbi:alginate lyase family protein [Antarcticirhabdus aurantiaca]|uniref:Alginate lyase family protein n=1 Tax=Antarcticirhabdus aurantiaca TaxID=2606717 RepID=A0ACD4NPD4_9HYPH|nr:alginate lyase family protein [Antarcticirhabdus aurantiaca]WAJ28731.1 alginate lyase family protein [Jeongeuplla avenae]
MADARRCLTSLAVLAGLVLSLPGAARADGWTGLFDVPARQAALKTRELASVRAACLAIPAKSAWRRLAPIPALQPTEGYGSDNSAEDFSWAVMVLSGRALGGDEKARRQLAELMLAWAEADAFEATPEAYDPYYALKRQLLPLAVAFQVLSPTLTDEEAKTLRDWIDPLVRRIDARFDGDVDLNNHRTLADSVLMVWGSIVGDEALFEKGVGRFRETLAETRADGTLPLEARRGARALWYQRQTLASLTVIAEAARGHGLDLYAQASPDGRKSFATLLSALLNGLDAPLLATVYSAENHIPGPEKDYLKPDLGFMETRGHGRHYMAFTEAAARGGSELAFGRLDALVDSRLAGQRPLIDEFVGGNATCFWGQPR